MAGALPGHMHGMPGPLQGGRGGGGHMGPGTTLAHQHPWKPFFLHLVHLHKPWPGWASLSRLASSLPSCHPASQGSFVGGPPSLHSPLLPSGRRPTRRGTGRRRISIIMQAAPPPQQSSSVQVAYTCGDCGADNTLRAGDVIRCGECGYLILYKKRTRRVVQYEAR